MASLRPRRVPVIELITGLSVVVSGSTAPTPPAAPPTSTAAPGQTARPAGGDPWKRCLELVALALRAHDAILWQAEAGDRFRVQTQFGLGGQSVESLQGTWPGHDDLLRGILAARAPRVVEARFEPAGHGAPPQQLRILAIPILAVGTEPQILEVFLPGSRQDLSDEQALSLAAALIESHSPSGPAPAKAGATASTSGREQLAEFALQAHRSLEVGKTAYAIVAEAQRLLQADRVSLLRFRGRGVRVLAVSGVDQPDPRAAAVRQLEELGRACRTLDRIEAIPAPAGTPSDPVRGRLTELGQAMGTMRLAVAPLRSEAGPIGLLVVEDRSSAKPADWSALPGVQVVSASAMAHAMAHSDQPLHGLSRLVRSLGITRTWLRLVGRLLLLGGLAAGGTYLAVQPATLYVTGRGSIVPRDRREVYAPVAGIVQEVRTRHGESVQSGQPVVVLRSPNLEFEMTRVQGELQTAEQQIADIAALRTDPNRPQNQSSDAELAAREEELKTVRESLIRQRTLLEGQQRTLTVPAPIAGQVLTWDVEQTLDERPVERGQRLLTVGDPAGPWIVEVRIPDGQMGHLQRARKNTEGQPLRATFSVTTDLDHQVAAQVESVADLVEDDPQQGPTVLTTLSFDRAALRDLRPGATAVARIDCGQRSLGYVWFHRLIETAKTWWEF